jgi:GTPase SAR1 family protein
MALVNLKKNEIQAKIVYYGPGRGGKTTNLEYIFKRSAK